MFKYLLATVLLSLVSVPGFVEWNGKDPYPAVDWSGAVPELYDLVIDFEKKWGEPLVVLQVYRPSEYGAHLRSVWELWRHMNGQSFTEGYKCEEYNHIDISKIKSFSYLEKKIIESEAKKHAFWNGGTPPACQSDHALGIAVDIVPPINTKIYKRWIEAGASVGLCHYIAGDKPHWAIASYLPKGTNCKAL
ncbi:MAG: hypothetical protein K9L98_01950 [Candidatus Pacebacteria bacterium]|nr:hypothetical protein [Candidatus Paceibacterota bacterium]MCF7862751.1 hypothetical protein [Candidatus Paceibacterota bacterium]